MPNALDHLARTVMLARGYREEHVEVATGRLAALTYAGAGELPPLTVLHGWASMGAHQALFLRRLRRRVARLVLPDLPGHGYSEAVTPLTAPVMRTAIRSGLDALQAEPQVIMGSSFGGLAAVHYALARPERVRSLILVSPFGAPLTAEEHRGFVEMLRARTLRDVKGFLDRVARRPQRRNWLFAPEMARILRRRPLQELLDRAADTPFLTEEELRRLQVPVLVVWGQREQLFPARCLDFWRGLPDVRIEQPAQSGHSPSLDEPARFEALVAEHLAGVRPLFSRPTGPAPAGAP